MRMGIYVGIALVFFVIWYALSDRYAPYASGASAEAYVSQIAPRVAGPVVEVLVEDNQPVTAGQALFRIDPTSFQIDVDQARAQLEQAAQAIGASAAGVAAAQAKLAQAEAQLANARSAAARVAELVARGVYPQSRADQATSELNAAEAAVRAAQAEVDRANEQLGAQGSANPQIKAASAALQRAQFNLVNTTVVAPADGMITNLSLNVGQYVATGQPAMTFIDPRTSYIVADFRENQLAEIQPGDRAEIVFAADPGRVYSAKVESIAWGIDSGRQTAGGLAKPVTTTQWFTPARRIPVRLHSDPPIVERPNGVRLGGEVYVVIYSGGDGPLAWVAAGLLRLRAVAAFLY